MAGGPPLLNEDHRNKDDFSPVEKKLPSWSSHCFASSFSSSGSSLSSPGESERGSTECESDQDDEYVAELTRRMAHYTLHEDCTINNEKALNLADKFQNLKINGGDDKFKYQNRDSHLAASLSPTSILPNPRNPDRLRSDFQSKQALIDEQIRAIKLNKFNDDKSMRKKQEDCLGRGSLNKQIRPVQSKASWANNSNLHNQQRTGSVSMRSVYSVEPVGPKNGSSGTGVFLPRGVGTPSEPRKQPGCSTVLIPAKVVQALKLHFDRVGVPSRSNAAVSLLRNADGIIGDGNYCLQLQEENQSRTAPAINHHNPEISCLPQEWPY